MKQPHISRQPHDVPLRGPGNASHVIEKSLIYCSAVDRPRGGESGLH